MTAQYTLTATLRYDEGGVSVFQLPFDCLCHRKLGVIEGVPGLLLDFDRLYAMYEAGDKNVFAVFSKERARDGYMRYPIVTLKNGEQLPRLETYPADRR